MHIKLSVEKYLRSALKIPMAFKCFVFVEALPGNEQTEEDEEVPAHQLSGKGCMVHSSRAYMRLSLSEDISSK